VQLKSTHESIYVGRATRFRIRLDPEDYQGGKYTFTVEGPAPATLNGTLGGSTTLYMKQGKDHWLDILFHTEGTYQLVINPDPGSEQRIDIQVHPAAEGISQVALVKGNLGQGNGDLQLWRAIRQISADLSFTQFQPFAIGQITSRGGPGFFGTDAFNRLSRAAEDFVTRRAVGLSPLDATERDEVRRRSYVDSRKQLFTDDPDADVLAPEDGVPPPDVDLPLPNVPFVELIWSYWMEEGMLVQSMNHIVARFQNRRIRGGDALARFDLNPLLPLRNLLFGFVEQEVGQLTVRRRAAEYEYEYGLRLLGRAVPPPGGLVERRASFLEAFHALLHAALAYFKERDDKTVDADPFPLLSHLREVHLLLAQGAHNQFADLPVAARAQMLAMQEILARNEMSLFLGGRPMVPYEEAWMDRVDTMKSIMGWPDASITHFFHLATHGEQLVLSIRHGRWNETGRVPADAEVWADTFRASIQFYVHAYRAVTGVDLAVQPDATMPSTLISRRLRRQLRRA